MIEYISSPAFKSLAALFFLDGGHYLFRFLEDGKEASKFVTAPDVAAAFSLKEIDTGWLPAGIVRCGQNAAGPWFVYSTPAQKVKISLDEGIRITVPVPRLLLVGRGGSYWLAAMHAKHFDPEAPVFEAPFPNVYLGGRICWGTSSPPEARPENAHLVWDLFFESSFNADLKEKKSKAHPKDVRDKLRELDRNQARSYPVNDLSAINRSAEDWSEQIIGGK